MRIWVWHLLGVGLLFWVATVAVAEASGVKDMSDGWLLGSAAANDFLQGKVLSGGGTWGTVGQTQLFGMSELTVRGVNVGHRIGAWSGQPTVSLDWQTLGEGIYREDLRQVHLQLGQFPVVGLSWQKMALRTGGQHGSELRQDEHWWADMSLQAGWRLDPAGRIQFQLWLPLVAGPNTWAVVARRPLLKVQGWQGAVALALAVDLKPDQTPAVNVEWDLAGGKAAFGLRVDLSTRTMGPVLYLSRGPLQVRTSHLAHPHLGVTHRLQVGFGAWGAPRW